MDREEKEQWLYETYQYTSNFDFNRLDKYEEANDDICIDDLILDYTMLYENYKDVLSIIKEVREYITSQKLHKFQDTTGGLTYKERKLLEILDKENKYEEKKN